MTEIPEHLRKRAEAARAEGRGRQGRRRRRRCRGARRVGRADAPAARLRQQDPRAPPRALEGGQGPQGSRHRRGRGRRRRRHPGAGRRHRRRHRRPAARRHRARPVTPSACSRWSSRARSRTSSPRRVDKVHVWPHLLAVEFVASLAMTGVRPDLLDLRERPAARAGQRQRDAEPVEGPVVLPRPAGAAHHVPPDGRGRDHPGHGHLPADPRALHGQEPVQQAGEPQVRRSRSSPSC